ncbi:hypothetical protein FOZ62_023632 [Perkinsus olseni]|uniref:Uncharacterized protein n=1 Tax=Perkinsus olseni TaxID=32597 RepID=A0A7J6S0N7_PEROL|nr:hypothetical protein FOZ62_023632 [Perkinsus olseni]
MVSIESIARTVLLECREKSIPATKGICDFTVATTRRDDEQIFYSEAGLEEKEASALSAKAIAVLSSEGNPAVETMRLQANFGDLFRCIESAAVNRDTERSVAVAGGIRRVVERSGDLDGRMDFEGYNQVLLLMAQAVVWFYHTNMSVTNEASSSYDFHAITS